jgi:hypothetical protein
LFGKELGIRREKFLLEIWLTPKFFFAKTSFDDISLYSRDFLAKTENVCLGIVFVEKFCFNPRSATGAPKIQKKNTRRLSVKRPGGWGGGVVERVTRIYFIPN